MLGFQMSAAIRVRIRNKEATINLGLTCAKGLCPRGDLNAQTRAFSPVLRLSTQAGEKSRVRGFHALMLAVWARPVSSGSRRRGLPGPSAGAGDALATGPPGGPG
jgi:hypothetical protein